MSINRVGIALLAAAGCVCASELSPAAAAEPGPVGRAKQLRPAAPAKKIEARPSMKQAAPGPSANTSRVLPAKKLAKPSPMSAAAARAARQRSAQGEDF